MSTSNIMSGLSDQDLEAELSRRKKATQAYRVFVNDWDSGEILYFESHEEATLQASRIANDLLYVASNNKSIIIERKLNDNWTELHSIQLKTTPVKYTAVLVR